MNGFNKLFPNITKKKTEESIDNILYICLVEFGWSYDQFIKTPIPVIMRLLKTHKKINEAKKK